MAEKKDFLYENDLNIVRRIAQILRLLIWSFPPMLLFVMSGQFYISYRYFFTIYSMMAVAVLLPTVMLKCHASLRLLKFVTVLAPTIAMGLLAVDIHVVLYLTMGIGIAISLFYHDKKLTFWTAVGTYCVILVSVWFRSRSITTEPQNHYFVATCVGYLIELVAMTYVAMKIAEDSRDMLEKLYTSQLQAQEAENKARQSDALREENRIAQQANRAKSVFLANMSHEIRTPINAIMGMNEMVLRESKEPEILEYAGDIQRAGESLTSIINDILDFSKIESGKLEIDEKPYRIQKMLTAVVQMMEPRAKEKNLELILAIDENLPAMLEGDEMRIRQIMLNLLSNAVKYTRQGSVTLTVTGKWQENSFLLCFGVKDTGIGIKEEDMHRLFYMFERLDLKKNRDVEGTGLGLVITKKLVEAMEGTLEMESTYGEGSLFTVRIPQKGKKDQKIGHFLKETLSDDRKNLPYTVSFTAPEAKILIVDDNEMNLTVAKNLLKKTLVQTTLCSGGVECLDMTRREYFDVILLDHMMPGMDGIETLHQMRASEHNLCRKTPVICMTANAMAHMREMYLKEGFDNYISKPVHGRELEKLIQSYLPPEKIRIPTSQELVSRETVHGDPEEGCFDRDLGLMYCGGEARFYGEILQMFASMYAQKSGLIQALYREKNWKEYAVQVHALKSSSLTLGAKELSDNAKALELAAKALTAGDETQLLTIETNHGPLLKLYGRAAEEADALYKDYLEV